MTPTHHHHSPPVSAGLMIVKQMETVAIRNWYEFSLSSKLVLTDNEKKLKPSYYTYSDLFQKLRESLLRHLGSGKGMTYVYYSPRRTGKTTAALAILECAVEASKEAFGEPLPCKFIDAGSTLRHSVRKAFGVPDGVDDLEFVNRVCFEVVKKSDGVPPAAAATTYSNSLGQAPPILVIDNVRSFHNITDMDFLEILYKACYAGRVLLYIFTDDEYIANMICGMNGQSRIRPLEGMFTLRKKHWEIVEDEKAITGKIAKGIAWRAQRWKRSRLTGIVTDFYHRFEWSDQKDSDGFLVFVADGMLPDMALELADKVMLESAPIEALQMSSRIRNSKYDDVYDDESEYDDDETVDGKASKEAEGKGGQDKDGDRKSVV